MAVLRVAHVWGTRVLDVQHVNVADGGQIEFNGQKFGQGIHQLAGTQLLVGAVPAESRIPALSLEGSDWRFFKFASCAVLGAIAAVLVFQFGVEFRVPEEAQIFTGRPEFHRDVVALLPQPKIKVPEKSAGALTEVAKSKTPAGPATPKQRMLEVKGAGLLGAMDALKGSKELFAGGGLSEQVNTALNGMKNTGSDVAGPAGLGGADSRGNGPGGVGPGMGIGGLGLPGRPTGPGGFPGGGLRKGLDVSPGPGPIQQGDGLSKELVAKVIRRHQSEIKYCYEQALQQKPELAGKVAVLFTIDAAGAISDANVSESTLDDASVEGCVLNRLKRWKFPEPAGGGVVTVTYPWIFRPAGAEE